MADRGVSRLSVAAIAVALACLLFACSAAASTWTADQLPDGNVSGDLFGVSCPSESFCVATGSNNTVATSGNPTGGVPAWNLFHIGPGSEVKGTAGIISPGQQLRGVSCPTASYCAAASRQGAIYDSGNPGGGPGAWREIPIDSPGPNTHLYGISCPSLGLCVAVATEGRIATSTNPSSVAPTWTTTQLPQPLELQGSPAPRRRSASRRGEKGKSSARPIRPAGRAPGRRWAAPASPRFTASPAQPPRSASPATRSTSSPRPNRSAIPPPGTHRGR